MTGRFREAEKRPEGEGEAKTALLVGVFQGPEAKKICEDHLAELEQLCDTLGIQTLQKQPCPLRRIDASTFLGSGKVQELKEQAEAVGADVVIFDDEILPSQQRNLEKLFGIPVIDRTEVILEVFAERAQTREARLQTELAQVKYQFPRLKRLWTHLSRQRGGGVNQKGEGETQIEIDRRLLKQRIEKLQAEIRKVQEGRQLQRHQRTRTNVPTFAIVGYTNAGKSTLLNALTQAGVLAEDKLFATLDTTTRKFELPNHQEILLIDTVGFIRKLPHLLVAAFRSTLEEAVKADILLHLVDVSHPQAEEQAKATCEVLADLGAKGKPVITVLNKIDQAPNRSCVDKFRFVYPKTVPVSALTGEGFQELLDLMTKEVEGRRTYIKLRVPQKDYAQLSEIMREGLVLHQDYLDNDILLEVEIPQILRKSVERFEVRD